MMGRRHLKVEAVQKKKKIERFLGSETKDTREGMNSPFFPTPWPFSLSHELNFS